jgi:superfamily I DNA and RNA helicase
MGKCKFKLPGIQDLSKTQEDARALPKDGQHLIIGGPGTGKSVLALLRSRRHSKNSDSYVFLVFNHLLNQSSKGLMGGGLVSEQWQSWFGKIYRQVFDEPIPLQTANTGSDWKPIDWNCVLAAIANLNSAVGLDYPYLVIDEGQDMPPQFYQALVALGFENFFVVADQNQQIVPDQNSTRQEIQNALAIKPEDVIELPENYRNTYPIARLAQAFYTGDPASPPPNLPRSRNATKRPILLSYGRGQFETLIGWILKKADSNPNSLIGIIAPNNDVRERYFDALKKSPVRLDNGRPNITTYAQGMSSESVLENCGVVVINAQSCKGLEFHVVFLADIHKFAFYPRIADQKKRMFYVMTARARDQIVMLKEQGVHCPVEEILPEDQEIMERK